MATNLCSKCLHKADLKVPQPQLLRHIRWCDNCCAPKASYDVAKVIEQLLMVQVRED